MQIDINQIGLYVLSAIVGALTFFIKRSLSNYDDSIKNLSNKISDHTDSFRLAMIEFQKELGQIRLESALMKQSSGEISKYSEKIQTLEKAQIILESQVNAAFAILSGKKKVRDD